MIPAGGYTLPAVAHVFISYSRADQELMRRLREDLAKAGVEVWTDEQGLEPGTPGWDTAIASAIESAACIVVLLSPDSKQSVWVGRELGYAEEHKARIIP